MSIFSVPLKVVLPWVADIQNESPPTDYAICDGRTLGPTQQDIVPGGSYTTPDLRNMFLVGADLTKSAGNAGAAPTDGTINSSAGAPGPKGTTGSNNAVLSVTHLPAHNHSYTDPGHNHGVSDPGHHHSYQWRQSGTGSGNDIQSGNNVDSVQGSVDSSTSSTGISVQTGTTNITIGNTGSGTAHESRPRCFGVVYIMKVRH
jgi:hypothetical protein